MSFEPSDLFDTFLSHSHTDSIVVESLGVKLADETGFRVWLDKWILVPGNHWQQEMARGLEQARTCAVCIGRDNPKGWFREEIEKALNRQTRDPSFRVIPVILPDGDSKMVDNFLNQRTWVDFRDGIHDGYAFHILVSGIRGEPPGRYFPDKNAADQELKAARERLRIIRTLRQDNLIDNDVAVEYQKQVLKIIIGI